MDHGAYLFDMDQTLTRSKSEIEPRHRELLLRLAERAPVVVVSGATMEQIGRQLPGMALTRLAQSGNHAVRRDGTLLWHDRLTAEEEAEVLAHVEQVARRFGYVLDGATLQNRGCQVSFSLLGHDAPLESKESFDPDRSVRAAVLGEVPFAHETLSVRIGGTTCLDYNRTAGTKGDNVRRLIGLEGFEDAVYVGDALFPGGNDSSVMGVCATYPVASVAETYAFVAKQLQSGA